MQEIYYIENLEQLRAVADVLRTRILELPRERPMTVTHIAGALHLPPAKVHYHVRELEKVGLLQLVETREKGGILEKYYQPVARTLIVPPGLLHSEPTNEIQTTIANWLEQIKQFFLAALLTEMMHKDQEVSVILEGSQFYMTREEMRSAFQQITEILKPYEQQRGIMGEREILSTIMMFPHAEAQCLDTPDLTRLNQDDH